MKARFIEAKFDSWLSLELESVNEVAEMVRTCKNAKKEPINMTVNFHEDGRVTVSISIRKKQPNNQTNYIKS